MSYTHVVWQFFVLLILWIKSLEELLLQVIRGSKKDRCSTCWHCKSMQHHFLSFHVTKICHLCNASCGFVQLNNIGTVVMILCSCQLVAVCLDFLLIPLISCSNKTWEKSVYWGFIVFILHLQVVFRSVTQLDIFRR